MLANLRGSDLPHLLPSGERWQGLAKYDDKLKEWAGGGNLFVAVYCSHSSKPLLEKIRLKEETGTVPN